VSDRDPTDSVDARPTQDSTPTAQPNIVRRLYNWVLRWADTPYGVPALFLLAVAESSFFPIPPDVLLIALAISLPTRAFRFAAWCTAGSVIGGVLGYFLGWGMWEVVEPLLIPHVFHQEKFDAIVGYYNDWGVVCVFVAGFSPVPYKVFTVAAGVGKLNLPAFIATSIVGRGARFFLVAAAVRRFGPQAKRLIDKYFNLLTIGFTVLLVGMLVLLKILL